ncbi:DNA mismatch repair endonuclease MutL [Pseudenhygromyxa sp. WMMC2535]|uniref:DNA mismatch repair endonuclease MutL n=1 Tax=Pseudenhygromyxa sp. WMMC2535 TaxID=2712867 RepID=UPI001551D080|nr:DNA mismatch repair endonuclease MutL [Pseudenhygromyxa sp. WMMC2535]NVB41243.1 DNA mismatch repair endonuclease MutL [Pseudenhygromyxa sp. WMMC2535]
MTDEHEREGEREGEERIAVLPAALADQIAAGEVVERPASIVKELVENAVDAGARRITVELEGGGREGIRVIDDGHGIHREDLPLAVTRHATSKLRRPDQLVEILTLGFRGEALASIAAVAHLEIRSRRAEAAVGYRLAAAPGERARVEPIGMPPGTQVEIGALFERLPARRKFLRSEATEVGHCVDAVTRAALVHPGVHFRVEHHGRELIDLPAGSRDDRVVAILRRRGGEGPFVRFADEREGVRVEGWFGPPSAATRQRSASFVVVRRRVVSERTLVGVLKQAYGEALPRGMHPAACLFVEPPRGTVDVNVHPQKSEVRFSEAQRVYAAVREIVSAGLGEAPWLRPAAVGEGEGEGEREGGEDARGHGWAGVSAGPRSALEGWSRRGGLGGGELHGRDAGREGGHGGGGGRASNVGYRLGTRAAGRDYASYKSEVRGEVDRLRARMGDAAPARGAGAGSGTAPLPLGGPRLPFPLEHDHEPAGLDDAAVAIEAEAQEGEAVGTWPRFLVCLPGPVALFEYEGALLSVDLRRLRTHLIRKRLIGELAETRRGERVPAQGLLEPVVLRRRADERARLLRSRPALAELGVELDDFGDDAVIVRAVPAVLRKLLAAREIGGLLDRLQPWLAMREREVAPKPGGGEGGGEGGEEEGGEGGKEEAEDARADEAREVDRRSFVDAVAELASAQALEASPRFARRWLAEALREHQGELGAIPGLRRFTVEELVG